MDTELYTLKDLINMTKLSERTLRRYLKEGLIEGKKLKGVWLFSEEAIKTFFSSDSVHRHFKSKSNQHFSRFLDQENQAESLFAYDIKHADEALKRRLHSVIKKLEIKDDTFNLTMAEIDKGYRLTIEGSVKTIGLCVEALKEAME